jgi:hypothetical protein
MYTIAHETGMLIVIDVSDVIVVLTTLVVVVIVVMTHYEGLHFFTRWMAGNTLKPRFRIVIMIYGLLVLHTFEITIFGGAYWFLSQSPGFGTLVAQDLLSLWDCMYFSATVYSTLGFGDLVPTQAMRLLAGIESVTGLLLITWSASFTYLEMVRYWRDED